MKASNPSIWRALMIVLMLILSLHPHTTASGSSSPLYDLTLALDGSNDYASAADSTSLDVGTGVTDDFTLETFFYVPDLSNTTNDTLFWKQGAYGLYILYYSATPDRFIFRIYTTPSALSTCSMKRIWQLAGTMWPRYSITNTRTARTGWPFMWTGWRR
jgi:hypothetical protein